VRIYRDTQRHEIHYINVYTCLHGDFGAAHLAGDQSNILPPIPRSKPHSPTPKSLSEICNRWSNRCAATTAAAQHNDLVNHEQVTELAWDVVERLRGHLTVLELNTVFIKLGVGEPESAIETVLRRLAANGLAIPDDLLTRLRQCCILTRPTARTRDWASCSIKPNTAPAIVEPDALKSSIKYHTGVDVITGRKEILRRRNRFKR
jgi:hypothetical protein